MSPLPLLSCYYCRIDNLICHLIGVLNLVLFSGYFHTSSMENCTAAGNMAVGPTDAEAALKSSQLFFVACTDGGGKGILVALYYCILLSEMIIG